jgi:hypothetical protein
LVLHKQFDVLSVAYLSYTQNMPARKKPSPVEVWIMTSAFLSSCVCGFLFFWHVIDAFDSTATLYGVGVMISSYIGVKVAGPKRPSVE